MTQHQPVQEQRSQPHSPSHSRQSSARPQSSDRRNANFLSLFFVLMAFFFTLAKCTLREHQQFDDFKREFRQMEEVIESMEKKKKEMANGGGGVNVFMNQKVQLRGKPHERLLQLDKRENELLEKINALTQENDALKMQLKAANDEAARYKEQSDNDAAVELQSILQAHRSRLEDVKYYREESANWRLDEYQHEESMDRETAAIVRLQSFLRGHIHQMEHLNHHQQSKF